MIKLINKTKAVAQPIKTVKMIVYLILSLTAFGQAYAQLELKKHTISNGGGVMTGSGYEIRASIGQVDAGNPSSDGDYQFNGGFWQQNTDLIFKNKFQ